MYFNEENGLCKMVCTKHYDLANADSQKNLSDIKYAIGMNYQHHWIIDNMPVIFMFYLRSYFFHVCVLPRKTLSAL